MRAYDQLVGLIHNGVIPYANFPFGQWAGHYNNFGSEREIFRRTMDRVKPRVVIEVGTFLGGSAMWMAQHAKNNNWDTVVLCVDTWLGGVDHWLRANEKLRPNFGRPTLYEHFLNNVIEAGLTEYIVPFTLDSLNAARFLKDKGITCQMVYIDGSHEEGDVLRDYESYWELLDSNGAFLVDDLTGHFPGVLHDWDRMLIRKGMCEKVDCIEGEKGLLIKP